MKECSSFSVYELASITLPRGGELTGFPSCSLNRWSLVIQLHVSLVTENLWPRRCEDHRYNGALFDSSNVQNPCCKLCIHPALMENSVFILTSCWWKHNCSSPMSKENGCFCVTRDSMPGSFNINKRNTILVTEKFRYRHFFQS